MSEQKVQKKILDWLDKEGFYTVKVISANKAGIPDIVGCTPKGRFFAIEVKYGSNKTSKLQDWNLKRIREAGGIACVAYDLELVKEVFKNELNPATTTVRRGNADAPL